MERAPRTGCLIEEKLVILDRPASRYFLVPDGMTGARYTPDPHPTQTILFSWARDRPLVCGAARERWITRASAAIARTPERATPFALVWLRYLEWRYERLLAARGLDAALALLERTNRGEHDPRAEQRLIGAAHAAERHWSAHDRCLPRSLALACALRDIGSTAELVVGVALDPFAAHAWVQRDQLVLNDHYDRVALFTPLLVA